MEVNRFRALMSTNQCSDNVNCKMFFLHYVCIFDNHILEIIAKTMLCICSVCIKTSADILDLFSP